MDGQSATRYLPTQDQKDALKGTTGLPTRFNLFVTDDDPRLLALSSLMKGTALANDGDIISHGFITTPSAVVVSGSVAGEIVTRDTISATTFTVRIKTNQGESGTPQNVTYIAVASTSLIFNGTATVSDGDTITHGSPLTPLAVIVSGSVAGEIITWNSLGALTFKVNIKTNQGEPGTHQAVGWVVLT
jgi:uncharacterized Zn-binding protein involved in type VI secretion